MSLSLTPTSSQSDRTRNAWRHSALACVLISLTFCLTLATYTTVVWKQNNLNNPFLNRKDIQKHKHDLQKQPDDTELQNQIRAEDVLLRSAYLQQRATLNHCFWLLAAGGTLLVLSIKTHRALALPAPNPSTLSHELPAPDRLARWSVAGTGLLLSFTLTASVVWAIRAPKQPILFDQLGAPATSIASTAPQPKLFPSNAELLRNWPVFRGWGGQSLVPAGHWTTTWDGPQNLNLLWKTPLPLPGKNSPIIWLANATDKSPTAVDRIFLSSATAKRQQIECYNLATGKLLWQCPIPGTPIAIDVLEDTGYAAPTLATDGHHVFALFATGTLAACDFSGNLLWQRNLGKPESQYGFAASLTLARTPANTSSLIVQWDVGSDPDQSRSALFALDAATGRTLWQTPRKVINGWSSPILANPATKPQIICFGNPYIAGYDPTTGTELWHFTGTAGDIGPSPICVNDTLYFAQDSSLMAALRIDQKGDATTSALRWQTEEFGRPDLVSPLSDGTLLWTITSSGNIQCFQASDGTPVWDHAADTSFHASPLLVTLADGQRELWLLDTTGTLHRLSPGRTYQELGTSPLGEAVSATPAFAADKIIIRGHKNLYCIGKR